MANASGQRFGKFTEQARHVLSFAQEEAVRYHLRAIGTEHILLGLVREGEGGAATVLRTLGINVQMVRNAVELIGGRGNAPVIGDIELTAHAKQVITLAVNEARQLNHHAVATEHFLLGLVRAGQGKGASVLESLGVNLEEVCTQTLQMLSQSGGDHAGRVKPRDPDGNE